MNRKFLLMITGTALLALGISFSGLAQAKDKTPPQYQSAKLKEIKETREPETVYRQVKQADGKTLTLPQTEYQKVYHIKVESEGSLIVGNWRPTFSFGKPPDWTIGQDLEIRIQKNHMWIKKPDGKELKTKIEERSQI